MRCMKSSTLRYESTLSLLLDVCIIRLIFQRLEEEDLFEAFEQVL